MSNRIINFNTNWNNKLECKSFTTLRIKNPTKYQAEKEYDVFLKGKFLKKVQIKSIVSLYLFEINIYISYIDTGYSTTETREILKKRYPKIDLDNQIFTLILLDTIK